MRTSVEKLLVMIVFSLFLSDVWGQNLRPESLSIAYWGEMISHPGLKAEANYSLKSWEKEKQKKNGDIKQEYCLLLACRINRCGELKRPLAVVLT